MDHNSSPTKRIYICDICEHRCDSQRDFKKHCNEAHRYTCDHCGNKHDSLASLDNHIRSFHRKNEISCEKCNSMFSNSENVRKHMSYMHNSQDDFSRSSSDYSYEEK